MRALRINNDYIRANNVTLFRETRRFDNNGTVSLIDANLERFERGRRQVCGRNCYPEFGEKNKTGMGQVSLGGLRTARNEYAEL